ncbi:alpha-1,3-glucosyltransferase [Ceratobasidium sp. AG-Ba]|nr:alpha-1,3-glucosyltransferase [Ceratobasidium sp. AG-Ba]QRW06564.1 alpha-1,3-glucosyltransferase [Ceratobasidium sp. AG-Ba]
MDAWPPSTDGSTGSLRRTARSANRPRLQSIGSESGRSVRSRAESETDIDEILSPQPRPHPKLLNTQLLQSQSRPLSPLNPSTRGRTTSFALAASTLHGQPHESFARRLVRWFARNGLREWTAPVIIAGAVLVRCAVGLGGYSGQGTTPMHGDYEAQRHWMEITYHLPLREWYSYDLQYWGLDYPPLTAYVSWICGFFANKINPAWVALDASRGHESPESKHFMRMSVLLLEMIVYIPAVYVYTRIALPGRSRRTQNIALLTVLLQPALVLIDHGHFQYNSVMLGLTIWAMNMFYLGHDLIGAICFVASLSFKQMGLYYAPAVGSYLLGKCFWLGKDYGTRHFVYLAFTTTLSFFLLFLPFMTPALLPQVITRIFPFARGLFEDKVANFWCASDVILIKWRRLRWISQTALQRVAILMTLIGTLPAAGMVFGWGFIGTGAKDPNKSDAVRHHRGPTLLLLPFALFSCAMSFFMFSVQVHEKSILLPLLPITLLLAARESESEIDSGSSGSVMGLGGIWEWGVLMNNVAVFSMWPLLKRDGQGLNYFVLTLLWNYVIGYDPTELPSSLVKYISLGAYATLGLIHILEAAISPPARYPDLFPVLNVLLSAPVFGMTWIAVGGIMMFRSAWATGGFDHPQNDGNVAPFSPVLKSPILPQSPLSEGSVRRRKGAQVDNGSRVIGNGPGVVS